MTKLSRWKVEPEKMALFLDDFWSAVASLESKQEAQAFFNQFLTHTERKMFAKRFQVIMMLLAGFDYTSIKNRVRVTDSTIAKMNNWIEENRETLITIAQRILSLKRKKQEGFKKGSSRHIPGDLLTPLTEEVSDLVIRSFAKRKKKESLTK